MDTNFSECVEEQKLIASFGKSSFKDFTNEEWQRIFEHTDNCAFCKREDEIASKNPDPNVALVSKFIGPGGLIVLADYLFNTDKKSDEQKGGL